VKPKLWIGRSLRLLLAWTIFLCIAFTVILYTHKSSSLREHPIILSSSITNQWRTYGGTWNWGNGIVRNSSDERGAKALTGSSNWQNYTLKADVKLDAAHGDMGVIVRSNHEEEGVDAYNGYYIGLRTLDGTLVAGRSDYGWMEARPVLMPGGVHALVWYRLTVTVVGCHLAAYARNLSTGQTARIAIFENNCPTRGRIGLRSFSTGGTWRNLYIKPAAYDDYLALANHAGAIEHPEFPQREDLYNRIFHYVPLSKPTQSPETSSSSTPLIIPHIGDLRNLDRSSQTHVIVRGVVTLTSPFLYVEDSTGGALVVPKKEHSLDVGDAVEVTGSASPLLYSAVLHDAAIRVLSSGTPLPPIAITSWQAASGAYDAQFVELEGRLKQIEQTASDVILDFTEGGQSFRAISANRLEGRLAHLKRNSYIRIRGICSLKRSDTFTQVPFVILLPSEDDVQIISGPPWWTPWNTGLVFTAALLLVFMVQLLYHRVRQWRIDTITRERERLAFEIHDTMAQSFAGIGYQIQGIQSTVTRDFPEQSSSISEQLSLAYQLVKRCHKEASQTIAILGSPVPDISEDLLTVLAGTAKKLACEGIKIDTSVEGIPQPLGLRIANAFLHIGQEAIVNAVGHAMPTCIELKLIYDPRRVQLMIRDNGSGFQESSGHSGLGIQGMKKRAGEIGGELEIVSGAGSGTIVKISANIYPKGLKARARTQLKKCLG
jgi:signal transduction histidine kinase